MAILVSFLWISNTLQPELSKVRWVNWGSKFPKFSRSCGRVNEWTVRGRLSASEEAWLSLWFHVIKVRPKNFIKLTQNSCTAKKSPFPHRYSFKSLVNESMFINTRLHHRKTDFLLSVLLFVLFLFFKIFKNRRKNKNWLEHAENLFKKFKKFYVSGKKLFAEHWCASERASGIAHSVQVIV